MVVASGKIGLYKRMGRTETDGTFVMWNEELKGKEREDALEGLLHKAIQRLRALGGSLFDAPQPE